MKDLLRDVRLSLALIETLAREIGLSQKDWEEILLKAQSKSGVSVLTDLTKELPVVPMSTLLNEKVIDTGKLISNLGELVEQVSRHKK